MSGTTSWSSASTSHGAWPSGVIVNNGVVMPSLMCGRSWSRVLSWPEPVERQVVVDVVEDDVERHADLDRVEVDVDQARRHAWTLGELDVRDRVRRVGLVRGRGRAV